MFSLNRDWLIPAHCNGLRPTALMSPAWEQILFCVIRLGMVAPVLTTDRHASPRARVALIMGDGFKRKAVVFAIVLFTALGLCGSVRSVDARGQVGSCRALAVCNGWLAHGGPACLPSDGGAFRARVMLCRFGSPVGRRGPPGKNLWPFYTRSEGFCLLVYQAPTPLLLRRIM